MQRAVRAHEVGNFAHAEWLCSGILAHYPEHFEALNLLGVIKAQTRRSQEAAALLEHAVAVRPGNATTHNNYANVLGDLGRFHEALERGLVTMSYSHVIRINPPLVITEEEAMRGVDILDQSFAAIARRFGLD